MGFRHYVHYAIAVLAMHGAAWLCRVIVLSGVFAQSIEQEDGMARVILILFSLFINALFCVLYARTALQDGERRRSFLQRLKEGPISPRDRFGWMWKKTLIHVAMFGVWQLPFLAFYSAFGIVYVNGTIFDSFYAMEAGFYEIFCNGILGFLLHAVFLLVGHILAEWLVYAIWEREAAE